METNKLKQQAIEAAYGKFWEQVKDFVTENGWVKANRWIGDSGNTEIHLKLVGIELECMNNYDPLYCYWFRPKSLEGMETNNGWISILSENDLPKDFNRGNFKLFYWTNNGVYSENDYKQYKLHYDNLEITHYRLEPILKFQPPIF